jgi:hypothetical protein
MGGRALFLAELEDVEEWPSTIAEPDVPFVVFSALDAGDIHFRTLTAFAGKLLRQGCAWWTAWGPACSNVHDAVDLARIEVDFDTEADFDTDWTLTTRHDDEPLDEALWYALFCSWKTIRR